MAFPELYPAGGDFRLPGLPLLDAFDVCVTTRINAAATLSMSVPRTGGQYGFVRRGAVVKAGGQLFILKIVADGSDAGKPFLRANGTHIFWELCERKHIPAAFWVGENAQTILAAAFAGITYAADAVRMLAPGEIAALGLTPVDAATDIEMDKPNPLEVLSKVVANVNGELYVDNFAFALVKKLGRDSGAVFRLDRNTKGIERTDEETKLVTRLYPYGRSGLEISSVNGGRPYIDSAHIGAYPYIHEGHMDFSDYADPAALLQRARMEFAADNPRRIDVPRVSFRCGVVDLWKLAGAGPQNGPAIGVQYADERLALGDYALVYDAELGVEARVRAVVIEEYPYEPHNSVITFGDPPRTVVDVLSDVDRHNAYFRMPDVPPEVEIEVTPQFIENLFENPSFVVDLKNVTRIEVLAAENIHAGSAFVTDMYVDRLWTNLMPFLCYPNLVPTGGFTADGVPLADWEDDEISYSCVYGGDTRRYIRAQEVELHFMEAELAPVEDQYKILPADAERLTVGDKPVFWTSIIGGDEPYKYLCFADPKTKYPNIAPKNAFMFEVYARRVVTERHMAGIEFSDALDPERTAPMLYFGPGDINGARRFYIHEHAAGTYLAYDSPANGFIGLSFEGNGVYYRHNEADALKLIGSGEGGLPPGGVNEDLLTRDLSAETGAAWTGPQDVFLQMLGPQGIFAVTIQDHLPTQQEINETDDDVSIWVYDPNDPYVPAK